jgi:ABC-2 type transport system ATP-binding protein
MVDAVQVTGLRKSYGAVTAVNGIDFRVPEGQVFAFLGPNGAGKTTTVEILEGLRRQTSGEVKVLGLDPWTQAAELHRQVGVIPQDFRFFEKTTPKEAIEYYGALFGTDPDPEKLLVQLDLTDKTSAHFDTLSGGQKQKLGLALALVNNPRVCFLDEPTTGLDPQARRGIWEVIRQLRKDGRTVFLTTHYLEEAELLADRVAIIHHGKIIAEGTPAAIIAAQGRPDRLTVEGPPSLADYLRRNLPLTVTVDGDRIVVQMGEKADVLKVLTAVEASGLPWQKFATVSDTLEDVFVNMVGHMDEGTLKSDSEVKT